MKKIVLSVLLVSAVTFLFAQDEEQEKGFKKENLFTGGSITVSFYSGGSVLGGNPMFGYKLANWADAGISLNYVYSSSRDNVSLNDKFHQQVLGPGVFARLYPFRFLYLEGQFEHNFISQKYIYPDGTENKTKADANSLLVGGGIAQGRQPGSTTFFYISILVDVLKEPNSPYVNNIYDPSGALLRTDLIPIIRAGVNIGLFQGKNKNNDNEQKGSGHRQPRNYSNL
jgi:hypothetical protein